jgi:spermidine synthase/MFS family permease
MGVLFMNPRLIFMTASLGFLLSGMSAIMSQICWGRILTVLSGIDALSATTVVAAFMAGLGLGNLIGGRVGDWLSPRQCVAGYAAVEIATAALIWHSPYLLYDVYGRLAPHLEWLPIKFTVEVALFLLPTLLMGATLPILARGLVRSVPDIAPRVGRLYGVNTFGAALGGVLLSGPWLLGHVGIAGMLRLAATLNLAAGALMLYPLIVLLNHRRFEVSTPSSAEKSRGMTAGEPSPYTLFAIYALSGFIALSLEVLWFRMLQALLVANTYTFALLLSFYLGGIALGAEVGSLLVSRVSRPARVFFSLQFGACQWGLLGPFLVWIHLNSSGTASMRPGSVFPAELGNPYMLIAFIILPATIMMGASFPFIQKMVSRDLPTLARRTGALLFANTIGAFLGCALTGLVFLEVLGTWHALLGLCFLALLFPMMETVVSPMAQGYRLRPRMLGFALVPLLFLLVLPQTNRLWAAFYRIGPEEFYSVEDRTGIVALKLLDKTSNTATIAQGGGFWQGTFPFDGFHLTLGLLPLFVHENPRSSLAIGLGIGSTPSAMAADSQLQKLEVVELFGGEETLLRKWLGNKPEYSRLFDNHRARVIIDDGRRYLLHQKGLYDVIVSDPTITWWACGVCLYTQEFYQLLLSRLNPGGLVAQWIPTERTAATAASVFPHVKAFHGPGFLGGIMLLSDQPIVFDLDKALARLNQTTLQPGERLLVERMLLNAQTHQISAQEIPVNQDLFPWDEYDLSRRTFH